MAASVSAFLSYCSSTLSRRLAPGTDEFWMAVCPVVGYWAVVLVYECLDACSHPAVVRSRVTRGQPGRPNGITRTRVFFRVLLQQALQTALALVPILADPEQCAANPPVRGLLHNGVQFVLAMFVLDAWQYWIHRLMHTNTWLYKHIHSTHHDLLVPYAMGALYNHPAEALLLDTLGAGVSMFTVGLSCKLATVFFTAATMKTVFDHSGYHWPLNPLHDLFPNCAAFHDVHHDVRHIKTNFSQPFFTHWDVIMGTFKEPAAIHLTQAQLDEKLGLVKKPWGVGIHSAGDGPADDPDSPAASAVISSNGAAVNGGGGATKRRRAEPDQ